MAQKKQYGRGAIQGHNTGRYMDDSVLRRPPEWTNKQKLLYITGSILIVAAVYLFVKYLFPIVAPFVIAYLLALLIERPVNAIARHLGGRKVLASTMIMIVLTALLVFGLGNLVYLGISEIKAFITHFDYYLILFKQSAARLCMNVDGWLDLSDGDSLDYLIAFADKFAVAFSGDQGSQMMTKVMSISLPFVIKVATAVGVIIITLISVVYLSNVLDKVRYWRRSTVFYREAAVVTDALKSLMNVYFKVQFLIMAINATLCTIGLMIIHNPYAIVIGILIGFLDALPIFGTGTVLLPWAGVMLLMRNFIGAAVLITIYIVTYFVREIMESKCMGDRLGIAPLTMLMIIFIGLMVFGILGFILGPVSYCIIKALMIYLKTVIGDMEINHEILRK